jgi:hypothetical protein
MIAEGTHDAVILAFALRNVTVRGKATPVLDITANVKGEGPVRGSMFLNDDDANPDKGYPCSRDRSFDTLRRIGWDGQPDGQFNGLVGKPVSVEVIHKASGGKTFANVKSFRAPVKSSVDPAAAAALFGASVKPFESPDDTDVPF